MMSAGSVYSAGPSLEMASAAREGQAVATSSCAEEVTSHERPI